MTSQGRVVVENGSTSLAVAREAALTTEALRYDQVPLYKAESTAVTSAMDARRAASLADHQDFCNRLDASRAEAAQRSARNTMHDVAHYTAATAVRRYEVPPVHTKWGETKALH
eukprot:TRINITY_DN26202_c0_g1_i1.p2 TRINITY_DN26202_c0_g1~~TRINITY_DN26202_c0_g1_i1.p2  ORF type:complete len:114 (+),score=32.97 TRINITY_DN26202_c0_g1_i1:58-399(+)